MYCGTKALGLYFQVMPKSALACVCCAWLPSGARTTGEAPTPETGPQERLKSALACVCCPWLPSGARTGSDGSMDQSGEAEEYPGSGCVLSVDAHVSGLWPG